MKGKSRPPSSLTSRVKPQGTAPASVHRWPPKSSSSTYVKRTSILASPKDGSRITTPRTSPITSAASTPPFSDRKAGATRLSDSSTLGRYVAYALIAVAICALGALLLYASMSRYLPKTKKETCDRPVCRQYASLLSMTINTSVNPCENFYSYVCDGWKRRNYLSVRVEQAIQFVKGTMSAAEALAAKAPTTGQTGVQKAAVFFTSCASVLTVAKKNEMSSLREALMEAHVTWPHFTERKYLIETMIHLCRVFDYAVGLDVRIIIEANYATVDVAPSYQFDMMYSRRNYFMELGNYEEYLQLFKERFRTPAKPTITYQEQIALEEKLFSPLIQATEYLDQHPETLPMTVQELARHTPGFTAQRWQAAFRSQIDVPANLTYTIRVYGLSYVKTFFNLTAQVEESQMQQFVGFAAVQQLAVLGSHDIAAILYGPGEESKVQYRELCSSLTNIYMGKAFVVPYLDKQLGQPSRSDITDIAAAVERTYKRIHGTTLNVGLPYTLFKHIDYFLASDLDKTFADFSDMGDDFIVNWKSAITSARRRRAEDFSGPVILYRDVTFYDTSEETNDVHLLPFAIGVPTYDHDAPSAIRYAGLGAELSMAINDVSKRFAHQDDDHHAACLKAASPEGNNDNAASDLLDRSLALETAWQSFKAAESLKPVGPGFSDLSQDQLFFFFWCYSLCSAENPERETHCNVPLQLSSDFSRVFRCRPGSPMNAENKCS